MSVSNLSLGQLLQWLLQQKQYDWLKATVLQAVNRQAAQKGFDRRDDYLDQYGVRSELTRALNDAATGIDTMKLAAILRTLRLPLEFLVETSGRPWDRWPPGSVLAVLMGKQLVHMPAERTKMSQYCNSGRDSDSLAALVTLLNTLGLQFRLELIGVAPDTSAREADRRVQELVRRKDVGGVVSLGSPIVNVASDGLARLILGDQKEGPPARFRFACDVPKGSFLCEKCRRREESGIRYRGIAGVSFPRTHNDDVLEAVKKNRRQTFPDCGMLIVDCREGRPLIVCAGHGGCGTLAATLALGQTFRLNFSLERDELLGPGRTVEIVTVRRHKPTALPVDDLTFDAAYGKGWEFAAR